MALAFRLKSLRPFLLFYLGSEVALVTYLTKNVHKVVLQKSIGARNLSHKKILKLFYKSQFSHTPVNSSFIITDMKNTLTDLWGIEFCKTT